MIAPIDYSITRRLAEWVADEGARKVCTSLLTDGTVGMAVWFEEASHGSE